MKRNEKREKPCGMNEKRSKTYKKRKKEDVKGEREGRFNDEAKKRKRRRNLRR